MQQRVLVLIFIVLLSSCSFINHHRMVQEQFIKEKMHVVMEQYTRLLTSLKDSSRAPRTFINGSIRCVSPDDWTSGFFAGSLWRIYEYSHDPKWKQAAEKWTRLNEPEQYNTHTHDLGFMLYCSYGNGFRLTGDTTYKRILIRGAESLATRFNPKVGCIKSWDWSKKWQYPVIIDNMMNLEYLLWASKTTGDSAFYKMAVSHANKTMKNHFRSDFSSYHVVNYDTLTGKVISRQTAQGASDSSDWARGQSWGLYGFTMMYRETRNPVYLTQAVHIAGFILSHLPPDKVPYWDYDAPGIPRAPKDASAAAVTASALFNLSRFLTGKERKTYFNAARSMLFSLSSPRYMAAPDENGNFILKHNVGNMPAHSEVDVPLIYADYYYVEALLRYQECLSHRAG